MVQNMFNSSIKIFQSDGGTEYVNHNFSNLYTRLGITYRMSCPHTPQQNGLAERKHCHIATMIRTLLATSHAPVSLWMEATLTAVSLINVLSTSILDWPTPHFRLFGQVPSYSHLRTFGCTCFPYLGSYVSNKLMSCSIECVFLGYSLQHN